MSLPYLTRIVNMKKTISAKDKKALLLKILGEIIKEKRLKQGKGILLLSYEFDISNSSISTLEKGTRDVQISTIWKIANALGMSFSGFINEVESRLPKDFKLIDD